jgi:hypothetical protein
MHDVHLHGVRLAQGQLDPWESPAVTRRGRKLVCMKEKAWFAERRPRSLRIAAPKPRAG